MRDFFEEFGINEFFAFVFPGMVLLTSFAIWVRPDFSSPFWQTFTGQEFLVAITVVVFSYCLGLVLASLSYMAHSLDVRSSVPQKRNLLSKILMGAAYPFYHFPSPTITPSLVAANLRISDDLERRSGVTGLTAIASPWDRLVVYRTLAEGERGASAGSVVKQAENLHRRFRFCLGVSLALSITVLQLVVHLALQGISLALSVWGSYIPLPALHPSLSVPIVIFGTWSVIALRRFASRTWDLESYLTASLAI